MSNKHKTLDIISDLLKRTTSGEFDEKIKQNYTIDMKEYGVMRVPCRWDIVTTTVESQLTEIKWEGKDTMFTIMGQPYRCECGCNVFRYNIKHTQAKCNACNAVYSTEK